MKKNQSSGEDFFVADSFGINMKKKLFKGIAFDEGVNVLVFFACIIILGIFFYISGFSITDLLTIGVNFFGNIVGSLVRALTGV